MPNLPEMIAVLGPTASGKTSLALKLAAEFNGEIISCDSMQVYKGLPIGTAQPTEDELKQVPHHFIANMDIAERYDASIFAERAAKVIDEVKSRGKLPIIAGGTGMYARILLYGGDMLPSDKTIAAQVREDYETNGRDSLIEEITKVDPQTAERVKDNLRRIFRAVEVIRITAEPIPEKASWGDEPIYDVKQFILIPEPEYSRSRITKRTKQMLEQGWIEEAETAIQNGLLETPTARQALGYSLIGAFLKDEFSRDELEEKLITKTCQYAKRQRTWFRHQHPGAAIINIDETMTFDDVWKRVLEELG